MDRFEKIIVTIIMVGVFFVAFAQISLNKEHNERKLHRQLQFQRFLDQKSFHGVFADYHTAGAVRRGEKR